MGDLLSQPKEKSKCYFDLLKGRRVMLLLGKDYNWKVLTLCVMVPSPESTKRVASSSDVSHSSSGFCIRGRGLLGEGSLIDCKIKTI